MVWKFLDPPNVAVIADREIIFAKSWISYVSHDAGDGGWQFHGEKTKSLNIDDAALVGLKEIVTLDASVEQLSDLPMGWHRLARI